MAPDDNIHSTVVGWLKLLLPLLALILLSTLFLFARKPSEPNAIPFAELDRIAQEQRMKAPRFSGMTADGAVITITAEAATPEAADILTIAQPRLTITMNDGARLSVHAGQGSINGTTQQADLTELARLETSTGYVMETAGVKADLTSGQVTSLGPLEILAPFGRITAGSVTITVPQDGGAQRIDFTAGVKLLYDPSDERDEE